MQIETMHVENFLMACDLSSHIDLLQGVFTHGRLHCFMWSDMPNGYDVERILRDRGIHAYGRMCQWYKDDDGTKHLRRWCHVNRNQADFAEYNLLGAGVMLESPVVNQKNWQRFGQGAAKPTWKDGGRPLRPTLLESVADWLEGLTR